MRLGTMRMVLAAALLAATPLTGPAGAQSAGSGSQPWWAHAVFYEIYPRSYGDADGDGVGDLNGITQHLDYLQKLGVDAIWIAPMFPSPQVDFGYDVSNYTGVDPQYGTMADFDRLQAEAGKRGIRVLLDMVMNHTSDKHAWFIESASSRTNPRADWYVWHDGIPADTAGIGETQRANAHDGRVPPNNWLSLFGGSAWEWVPARHQFYYHRFYKQQPDLNWHSPAVEQAMFGEMRFWLDKGVAGFRLDAIPSMFEDPKLRDEPATGGTNGQGDPNLDHIYTDNLPEVHDVIRRMRKMVDSYPGNRMLIGETYLPDTAALDQWYGGKQLDELHLPMDMFPGFGPGARYDAGHFRRTIEAAETQLNGPPLFVFDNHDNPRSIDRFGDGKHDLAIAKGLAAVLLMPRGAALTYYGAPIGMRTDTPKHREDVRDPIGITGWPKEKGRDGERTPMQWTPGPQAGFSINPKTWLPVSANHATVNVESELTRPDSLLSWYRQLIALRRSEPALRAGRTVMLDRDNPDVLSFQRVDGGGKAVVVAINMGAEPRTVSLDDATGRTATTLLATDGVAGSTVKLKSVSLAPFATWIGRVR